MQYLAVKWAHQRSAELDEERWEVRKVEVYSDGRVGLADGSRSTGDTQLGDAPLPPLAEIASDLQFTPREITREEFERVWTQANRQRDEGDHTIPFP